MFKLAKMRVAELATIVDSIPLKECTLATEPILLAGISQALRRAAPETVKELEEIQKSHNEIVLNYQNEFNETTKDITDEKRKTEILNEINAKMGKEYSEKIDPRYIALEENSQEEVPVELEGEKMKKLKEVFEKYGLQKYNKRDVFVSVAQALGVGV